MRLRDSIMLKLDNEEMENVYKLQYLMYNTQNIIV